jgi:O-methyltransferase
MPGILRPVILHLVKQGVALVGLAPLARAVKRNLKARGLLPWPSLVPEQAFSECVRNAIHKLRESEPLDAFGDYLEFGVSRGTSLACVDRVLREEGLQDVRLIGFDSFEGMPPGSEHEGWAPGDYMSTLAATRRYLRNQGTDLDRTTLVKGWFNETRTAATRRRLNLQKVSLVMIDSDIYSASKEALNFVEPHLAQQAVIMFDDWGWRSDLGEIGQQEAFNEFLAEHQGLTAEPLPGYLEQSRVFLVRREPAASLSVPTARMDEHMSRSEGSFSYSEPT